MSKLENTLYRREYQKLVFFLKKSREYRGLTQAELASLLGVDQTFVSKYENFIRKIDCIELFDICLALDISIQDAIDIIKKVHNERFSQK